MLARRLIRPASVAFLGLILAYLLVPTLIVMIISFGTDDVLRFPPSLGTIRWYEEALTDPTWTTPAVTSLIVAAATAVLATALATAAAYALFQDVLPFQRAIEAIIIAPALIPPIIIAVGGYGLYVSLRIHGSLVGLVLVHTVLAMPYAFLVVTAALHRLDPRIEQASISLGAGPFYTLRRVTLPLLSTAILIGGLFAFLTSFDEVVLALFLVSGTSPTLPLRILSGITIGVSPTVAAISSLLVLFSLTGVFAVGLLQSRFVSRRGHG